MRIALLDAAPLHRGDLDSPPYAQLGSLTFDANTLAAQHAQ